MMKKKEILQSLLKLVVIVFAATVLGKIFTGLGFPETNIVVMYLDVYKRQVDLKVRGHLTGYLRKDIKYRRVTIGVHV